MRLPWPFGRTRAIRGASSARRRARSWAPGAARRPTVRRGHPPRPIRPTKRGGRCPPSSAAPGRRPSSRPPHRSSPTCPATPTAADRHPLGCSISSPSLPGRARRRGIHAPSEPHLERRPLPGGRVQRHAAGGGACVDAGTDWEAEDARVVSRAAGGRAAAGATSPSPLTAARELPTSGTVPAVAPSAVATPASGRDQDGPGPGPAVVGPLRRRVADWGAAIEAAGWLLDRRRSGRVPRSASRRLPRH